MSHSWIKSIIGRLEPAESVGIAISRHSLSFAHIKRSSDGFHIVNCLDSKLELPLFVGKPVADFVTMLGDALTEISAEIKGRYLPVHVSLADAATYMAVYELDALPKKIVEMQNLIRWCIQQDIGTHDIVSTCIDMGLEGNRHLALGLAVDEAWKNIIMKGLACADIKAWSLTSDTCRQFNRFHDSLVVGSGALINLSDDYWTLLLWERDGRVRYSRSRWRSKDFEYAELAAEIERSIIAYVHTVPGRSVDNVYVITDQYGEALPNALDARLSKPCIRLNPFMGVTSGKIKCLDAPLTHASFAAALI